MTGMDLQRGLFMYISGQIELVTTPARLRRLAYSVSPKALSTAGAAVNTVGMTTFLCPASSSAVSTRFVQSMSWLSDMCGQPRKQSFGLASRSFQMQG